MRSLHFGQTAVSSSSAGGRITGGVWGWVSAGGGSDRGNHLIASVHGMGLPVLRGTLSTFHHKPDNKEQKAERWSAKGLWNS